MAFAGVIIKNKKNETSNSTAVVIPPPKATAYIKDLDQFGKLRIKFKESSQDANYTDQLSSEFFNDEMMNISVVPGGEGDDEEADIDLERLAIDHWQLEEFDEDKKIATINIEFAYPYDLSAGALQDIIQVEFLSQNITALLQNNSLVLLKPCKK